MAIMWKRSRKRSCRRSLLHNEMIDERSNMLFIDSIRYLSISPQKGDAMASYNDIVYRVSMGTRCDLINTSGGLCPVIEN